MDKQVYKMKCENCGYTVSMGAYTKAHGDKCAYEKGNRTHKRCKTCGKMRPLSEYYKLSRPTFDGLGIVCKECVRERNNAFYRKKVETGWRRRPIDDKLEWVRVQATDPARS